MADPYAGRTWLDFLKDARANAKENKDPLTPRAAPAPPAPASVERAKVNPGTITAGVVDPQSVQNRGIRPPLMAAQGPGGSMPQPQQAPSPAAGTGTTTPGTGVITDSTGRKVWFDGQNIQSSGERTAQPWQVGTGGGIRSRGQGDAMPQASAAPRVSARDDQAARQNAYGEKIFGSQRWSGEIAEADKYKPMNEINYRGIFSNPQVRAVAMERDARIKQEADRKQFEADSQRMTAEAAQAEIGQRPELKVLENQGRLADAELTGQYGIRQAQVGSELRAAQADAAKQGTDLFNRYQAETDPVKKAALRDEYNLLQGVQEKAPFTPHFGETTNPDLTTTPYAIVPGENGGIRMVRPQEGGAPTPRKVSPEQFAALKKSGKFKDDAALEAYMKANNLSM